MTQYKYNVGSSTVTGNLTWNSNGTLKTLAITDPLNSGDTQTCNYAYDDLARLSSANCGTPWSQTFTYDSFGNITKSGSISWQPGYNAANNHYTLGGTGYDANGNLTADTFHTYTWDGNFGNPLSIDTNNLTYDALGRLTEVANGTTYTQFVYGPTGKLAVMKGQAVAKVFIALPAGAQAVYTGSNNLQGYRHSDWLGSSRIKSSTTQTKQFDGAYAPFGESYADTGSYDHVFTGQIPGVVSDLYDFLYREYHPKQGRWVSPDPAGLGAVDMSNPQTWNRYADVGNNPVTYIDPAGLSWEDGLPLGIQDNPLAKHPQSPFTIGGGGGGTTCKMDGVETDCGIVEAALNSGTAAICPPGAICVFNENGLFQHQWTPDDGWTWNRVAWTVTGPAPANNGNVSWWGAFAKNLFSWENFTAEFKQGGCVNVFGSATAGALNPFSPSLSSAGEGTAAVLAASKYNAAVQYAASAPNFLGGTGLIYPMKSSVVRSMVADANATAAEAPLFAVDGALLQGVIAEGISMANGECH
jgi:RHS repeat-associated protein